MSDFWTVRFLKIESEPNLGVSHIPTAGKAELNTNRHEQHQLYVHDEQKIRQKTARQKTIFTVSVGVDVPLIGHVCKLHYWKFAALSRKGNLATPGDVSAIE